MRSPVLVLVVLLAGSSLPQAGYERPRPLLAQWTPPVAASPPPAIKGRAASARLSEPSIDDGPLSGPWAVGAIIAVAVLSTAVALFLLRLISLRAMGLMADAQIALAEKRSQLAAVAPGATTATALSLSEIDEILVHMPEVSPELRDALLKLLELRLKEKD